METLKTLLSHRTIRKYKSTPIEQDKLDAILTAAIRGSNTGNMQVYSIIVTTEKDLKKQLAPAHFNQKMVEEAPVLLTFCADFNRFNLWCKQREAEPGYDNFQSFSWAMIDAVIAAQNAAIAAESYGLGICYLGTTTYNASQIIDILNIPQNVVPITALTIGYADESPEITDRLPLEAVVHYEKYNNYSPEDIDNLYYEKEISPLTLKLIEENKLDNLAQIFTQNRYKKNDNKFFSKKWLEILEKQGFMNNEDKY